MNTYKQMVYMVLDSLKLMSDDSTYTEDHVIYLLSKYRALLLSQKYSNIKKDIPLSNYQTLCLDLEEHEGIEGLPCEGTYMRSTVKIPDITGIGQVRVHSDDYFNGDITFVSRERLKYVGHNKWLQNIIYAAKGPDDYLYLKSSNPQMYYLENIKVTGVFTDVEAASELECNKSESCDILDKEFPIEEDLIPTLIELVVKFLSGAVYKGKDEDNNASDDLSDIAAFLRRNMKSNFQKKIEE